MIPFLCPHILYTHMYFPSFCTVYFSHSPESSEVRRAVLNLALRTKMVNLEFFTLHYLFGSYKEVTLEGQNHCIQLTLVFVHHSGE